MKDMQGHLKTLRMNVAECKRLYGEARSQIKRDVFGRLIAHYEVLAGELERAIAEEQSKKECGRLR
ncbi:hypothetical protein [Bradyrhizobium sp. ARR65]|uniref:hypothetical protein n=1 Tax=Bradyrhizobium sp. ARR65 TaxID=1040989 RepID=UPI0007C466AB|nr:hypothetical protein [Bradyrhizobium sp. ARR65]